MTLLSSVGAAVVRSHWLPSAIPRTRVLTGSCDLADGAFGELPRRRSAWRARPPHPRPL